MFPLERRILEELVSILPPNARELAKQQIERANAAQRGGNWDVLLFGRFRFRKIAMPSEFLLPISRGDVKISRIEFDVAGQRNNAVLHAQNGALFSINFASSYRQARDLTEIEIISRHCMLKSD